MILKATEVKKILTDPIKTAEVANLIYVTEEHLTIERHKRGKGYFYLLNGEKIACKDEISRFKSLVIPPAWANVRITPLKNGHLQVVGYDVKERKQYRYHPSWNQIRNKTKFFKMEAFGKMLPKIREQVERDLKLPGMGKRKCLALILALMEETHIRIGNECYAKSNKTYGLSTLRNRHLQVDDKSIVFNFIGKKGKKHNVKLENKRLKRLVLQSKEIPGWELFQYYEKDGTHHSIDSGMVNDYIREISGDIFSAKDFRTWSASKIFLETLSTLEEPANKTELNKQIIEAYDAAASGLGNTRTVCKKYYVHPALPIQYEDGSLRNTFKKIHENNGLIDYLTSSERVLLNILSKYKIELEDSE